MSRISVPVSVIALGATLALAPVAQAYSPEKVVAPRVASASHGARVVSPLAPFAGQVLLADASSAKAAKPTRFMARMKQRFANGKQRLGRLVNRLVHRPQKIVAKKNVAKKDAKRASSKSTDKQMKRRPAELTAKEAASLIQPGDVVFTQIGHGAAHAVLNEVAAEAHKDQSRFTAKKPLVVLGLSNTSTYKLFPMDEGKKGRVVPRSLFMGAKSRDAVAEKVGDWIPIHLGNIPSAFRSGEIKVDKALIKVSPPDKDGYVTLGTSTAVTPAAMDAAKEVIAVVNENVPVTNGAARIHISKIDKIVKSNLPMRGLPAAEVGDVEKAIAKHTMKILRRHKPQKGKRRTMQIGIGGAPDAIIGEMVKAGDKVNIFSEMISDGTLAAIEGGIVHGKAKYTFFMGTDAGLKKLHNNKKLKAYPTEAINDLAKVSQMENFTAINGAAQVDLNGAINAQMIDNAWYSGVGGQDDFMSGAIRAPGGLAISVLSSTAKLRDGTTVSKIVMPWALGPKGKGITFKGPKGETLKLEGKAPITTTSMHNVSYVVTENGAARVYAQEMGDRVKALIKVADPRFRPEMWRQFNAHQDAIAENASAKRAARLARRAAQKAEAAKNAAGDK